MNFKRCKNFTKDNELNRPNNLNYKLVPSFNNDSNWDDEKVKFIIIGTLTPYDGRKNGYFYASQGGNAQIRIIDEAVVPNCGIKKLYEQLKEKPKNNEAIQNIKNALSENKIAFLDVIKKAYSPNVSKMASDDLIGDFILDIDTFRKVFESKREYVFICNSKNAKKGFDLICKSICGKVVNSQYCPQYSRRNTMKEKVNLFNKIYFQNH